jgi:hypothetical protein
MDLVGVIGLMARVVMHFFVICPVFHIIVSLMHRKEVKIFSYFSLNVNLVKRNYKLFFGF